MSLTASSSHPTEPPSNQMYSCSSVSRSSAAPPAPADEDRVHAVVEVFRTIIVTVCSENVLALGIAAKCGLARV